MINVHYAAAIAASVLLAADATAAAPTTSSPGWIVTDLHRARDSSAYLAKFAVGSPPQHQSLLVDTGSPTYSFLSSQNPFCNQTDKPCIFGSYNNLTSKSASFVAPAFNDVLIDHGYGSVLADTVHLGGVCFNATFGYVEGFGGSPNEVAKPTTTILGLALDCSFSAGPNCTARRDGTSLLQDLRNTSTISRRAFSLYLGPDAANATGQLILGPAYDRAKQAGTPFTVPMTNPKSGILSNGQTNSVNVTKMTLRPGTGGGGVGVVSNSSFPTVLGFGQQGVGVPVPVDSGNPFWALPTQIWNAFFEWAGRPTERNQQAGYYVVDCSLAGKRSSPAVEVEFAGKKGNTITVPFTRMVSKLADGRCGAYMDDGGNGTDRIAPLGAPFMRSTYIIFDADSLTVTMAPVRYTTKTDVVPFPAAGF